MKAIGYRTRMRSESGALAIMVAVLLKVPGRGGGGDYGTKSSIPGLVQ